MYKRQVEEYRAEFDVTLADWAPWPADKLFTLTTDDGNLTRVTALPAVHCSKNGPGFFASTNF